MRLKLFSLALLAVSLGVLAQELSTVIEGEVVDMDPKSAKDFKVLLLDSEGNQIASKPINKHGHFKLTTIDRGPFYIGYQYDRTIVTGSFFLYGGQYQKSNLIIEKTVDTNSPLQPVKFSIRSLENETNRIGSIKKEISGILLRLQSALVVYSLKNPDQKGKPFDFKNFSTVDFTADIKSTEVQLLKEENQTVREAILVKYLSYEGLKSKMMNKELRELPDQKMNALIKAELNKEIVVDAMNTIPPTSLIWAIEPTALRTFLRLIPERYAEYRAYYDDIIYHNPSDKLKREALYALIEYNYSMNYVEDYNVYYDYLIENFPRSKEAFKIREIYEEKNAIIEVGQKAPIFTLDDFDNPGQKITNGTFQGKTVLVDFWAFFCRSCIEEMPKLQELYERYNDKGFEILSVNLDGNQAMDALADFRKNRHALPWFNAIAPGRFEDDMALSFGVFAVPTKILIDEKGEVIAKSSVLRADGLERILESRFKK